MKSLTGAFDPGRGCASPPLKLAFVAQPRQSPQFNWFQGRALEPVEQKRNGLFGFFQL